MAPVRGYKKKRKVEKRVEHKVFLASGSSEDGSVDWWEDFSKRIPGMVCDNEVLGNSGIRKLSVSQQLLEIGTSGQSQAHSNTADKIVLPFFKLVSEPSNHNKSKKRNSDKDSVIVTLSKL
ncbi:hypothetical protein RJ639_017991 [Escallonia herrerae]|uniref:Uncharacterized protein n=1 Tax=Escallonia herrerae TaxID=1293975 RepID=A0AA88V8H3_9ASTE|nr:hypothetical protein RJ639_017991 [Escallonia herrerae]